VTHITEHDTEQEREGDTSEDSGVDFFVHGDTISVDDLLEGPCELVSLEVSRRFNSVVTKSLIVSCGVVLENLSDLWLLLNRAPEETNVSSSTLFHLVEGMVESLFFGNEPFVNL
jgi:hypothetical protein